MIKQIEKQARKSGLVRVRGGYSDKKGISSCNTIMQIDEFDNETRVQMSNLMFSLLETVLDKQDAYFLGQHGVDYSQRFCVNLLNDVFCEKTFLQEGQVFIWRKVFYNRILKVIEEATYNEVLDIIEYICQWIKGHVINSCKYLSFDAFNDLFEREYVGFRFIDGTIVPITDENEIRAIEEVSKIPFDGCRIHVKKAVGFLSDRTQKDYKNCIKESISAVESVCQVICNNNKVVLNDALKLLEKKGTTIHPALNQAFQKLYAYTSDQGGIRHAEGMFESNVTFEEAKFMLVSCSAFINYLIAEYGKGSK